jgi:ABC-type antimicrobial peptide transport system permease subunit
MAGVLPVLLATAPTASAQNVPQGYQSDQSLQKGMMIRLKPGDGSRVQAVTQEDASEMFGVVVSSSEAPVSLSNTAAAQEIFIANSGQYEALVSTQNGTIKTGDYITVSSLSGVGMKADKKDEFVLGKALNDFDGRSKVDGSSTLKTSAGDKQVNLGRVAIEIAVAHNPNYQKEDKPGVPQILSNLAKVVTDKPVGPFRIYASVAVLVTCLIVAGVVLFTGVRTGMTAVGRNPLAKKSIGRGLFQVTLMALIVFVIGVIAVYLLLRI